MMNKFTNGPWALREKVITSSYQDVIDKKDAAVMCQISISDISTANAHLIAAAPDMYKTLEATTVLLTALGDVNNIDLSVAVKGIEIILSSARGE